VIELIVPLVLGVNCLMADISLKGAKLIKVEREHYTQPPNRRPIPAVVPAFWHKKCSSLALLYFDAFHSMEEVMNSINWTKFYDLYVQNEHFKVFIL